MRDIKIYGFDRRLGSEGEYVRWTMKGKDHHCPLATVLHYCEYEMYGLTEADADTFTQAHRKHMVELEIGRKIPGQLHHVGERVQ